MIFIFLPTSLGLERWRRRGEEEGCFGCICANELELHRDTEMDEGQPED